MSSRMATAGGGFLNLLPVITITTAITATAGTVLPAPSAGGTGDYANRAGKLDQCKFLVIQAVFTYGSGGTNVDVYVQTSLDGGATWVDIAEFRFLTTTLTGVQNVVAATAILTPTTPSDGSLAANTAVSGILGDRFRVKYKSTGTYAGGTTLSVTAIAKG